MEIKKASVPMSQFLNNLNELKCQYKDELPSYEFYFKCGKCPLHIPYRSNGIQRINHPLNKDLGSMLKEQINWFIKSHFHQGNICKGSMEIDSDNIPENFLLVFPESDLSYLTEVAICGQIFKPMMAVVEDTYEIGTFALYQREDIRSIDFKKIIICNFDSFLNVDNFQYEEDIVFDDDSYNLNRSNYDRMTGGGRKLNSEKNYMCQWCPESITERGLKGHFKEYRSYKDHFVVFHHKKDGIPMDVFNRNVVRSDPKWLCKKCNNLYSLVNAVRHNAICPNVQNVNQLMEADIEPSKNLKKDGEVQVPENVLDISTNNNRASIHNLLEPERKNKNVIVVEEVRSDSLTTQTGEMGLKIEENVSMKKVIYDNLTWKEVESEFCFDSSFNGQDIFQDEMKDICYKESKKVEEKTHEQRWWLNKPHTLKVIKNNNKLNIFFPTDSDEFVQTCIKRFKRHEAEMKRLDEEMIKAKSDSVSDTKFSEKRDQPLLNRYKEYVSSSSKKDILRIFSKEYEILDCEKKGKSSTAENYSRRIIEFFKFMSSRYTKFHFDWLLDYTENIEKRDLDGTVFHNFFIPKKSDFTDFIRKYKYGSNPAANCGLRIFALKKLLSLLVREIQDHEHCFNGTIVEQRKMVEALEHRLNSLNSSICPDGTIKNLATASNKNHRNSLVQQLAKCPDKTLENIMRGVCDYINSEDYAYHKTKLIELGCRRSRVVTAREYIKYTNWLLEQLICIGGNRPCALLGITVRDWQNKKAGFCPFNRAEDNNLVVEDSTHDKRKVLKDPFTRPKDEKEEFPTGVIVYSDTDKIAVSQPCYIWFPNELVELVNYHSLLTEKYLSDSVDIYHPTTRLFLNSNGKEITSIKCEHLKNFLHLPIIAYDFRKSLVTYCLDSGDAVVRQSESSVLRHSEDTGFAYYYQKHGERVEYVNIQYALSNGLIKADTEAVKKYGENLNEQGKNNLDNLSEKRILRNMQYEDELSIKQNDSLDKAKEKSGRNWILPKEYNAFIKGIEEAISAEQCKKDSGQASGPFSNLLNYKPIEEGCGLFPPLHVWKVDMYRVLFGLDGPIGESMRLADLTVYDGVPLSEGLSGRKKIASSLKQSLKKNIDASTIVAAYWREKIRAEARQRYNGKWLPMRFIFTPKEFEYHKQKLARTIKSDGGN